jgi:hypothetical protein
MTEDEKLFDEDKIQKAYDTGQKIAELEKKIEKLEKILLPDSASEYPIYTYALQLQMELEELKEEIFTPTHTLTEWKISIIDRIIGGEGVLREIKDRIIKPLLTRFEYVARHYPSPYDAFDENLSADFYLNLKNKLEKLDGEKSVASLDGNRESKKNPLSDSQPSSKCQDCSEARWGAPSWDEFCPNESCLKEKPSSPFKVFEAFKKPSSVGLTSEYLNPFEDKKPSEHEALSVESVRDGKYYPLHEKEVAEPAGSASHTEDPKYLYLKLNKKIDVLKLLILIHE